jgi:hypothetical protein
LLGGGISGVERENLEEGRKDEGGRKKEMSKLESLHRDAADVVALGDLDFIELNVRRPRALKHDTHIRREAQSPTVTRCEKMKMPTQGKSAQTHLRAPWHPCNP